MRLSRSARVVAILLLLLVGCTKFGTGETTSGTEAPSDDAGAFDAGGVLNPCTQTPAKAPCEALCGTTRCASCLQIVQTYADAPNGAYAIARKTTGDPTVPVIVYCDMKSFGGGWLLVGRSHEDGADSAKMGWRSDTGTVFVDSKPYSLDTTALLVAPKEMLYGARAGTSKEWGANVYKVTLPANFLTAYTQTGILVANNRVGVKGTCNGGFMQSYIGHTAKTDNFFFRDNADADRYGLGPTGFETNDSADCEAGGLLSDIQGMIFIR